MKIDRYLDLQTQYGFTETELNCIFLNMAINNQEIAYAGTIGKIKKSRSMQNAGNYFFNKLEVKKFMHEQKSLVPGYEGNKIDIKKEQNRTELNYTKKQFAIPGESQELTRENIKQVLESELSKITEPEKRTALLIRITDLLSLQNNNSNELERPVIYLPGEAKPAAL